MAKGSYAVIRYTADTARKEPRNVGIVAWNSQIIALRIDPAACEKIVSENPHLDVNALSDLDEHVRDRLLKPLGSAMYFSSTYTVDRLRVFLERAATTFLSFTEPRYTFLDDDSLESIEAAIDRLTERLVVPLVRDAA